MLDPLSLRVALSAVSATLLVLAYVSVFRRTRSRYSAWWLVSLVATGASSAMYALNGTAAQALANPLANGVAVAGAACTWAAARSLRRRPAPWMPGGLAVAAVLAVAFLDAPATDVWTGGEALLLGMSLMFTLAAREMRRVQHDHRIRGGRDAAPDGDRAVTALGVGVTGLAGFYWVRTTLFVAVGPEDPLFEVAVGGASTTLALIVAMVVVTFTMTELSQVERVRELEIRATHDALTGLWNREEFMARAQRELDSRSTRHAVVIADLDHFKAINDEHGHAAGDRALEAFATAVRRTLGPRDLAGRLGGEEFALLLATGDPGIARARAEALSAEYAVLTAGDTCPAPTVSYGIAVAAETDDLPQALRRADAAMYRAKRAGRDRAVVDGQA